ncbi:DsbA family oxidoreductase [Microlunatus ginsengisoli]|uniref:DsbA family oxidoreductase n=1 Tax=Microlunatus ginsengisoli TaxID=363863 RepID=A0ABP6ZN76_9ACTN
MLIEIFSDVVCPWCYIGKRRLERALAEFTHRDGVELLYRSFELDPTTPKDSELSLDEMLAAKYGRSLTEARAMNQRVSDLAAEAGLRFDLARAHPANTFDAHRLLHHALAQGRQAELTEQLLRAYFTEGARLADHRVLADLAAEVGLDRDTAAAVLAGQNYADAVRADLALARSFGATGVPFFVFDRRYGVSGAQDVGVFAQVLERAWSDREGSDREGSDREPDPVTAGEARTDEARTDEARTDEARTDDSCSPTR